MKKCIRNSQYVYSLVAVVEWTYLGNRNTQYPQLQHEIRYCEIELSGTKEDWTRILAYHARLRIFVVRATRKEIQKYSEYSPQYHNSA